MHGHAKRCDAALAASCSAAAPRRPESMRLHSAQVVMEFTLKRMLKQAPLWSPRYIGISTASSGGCKSQQSANQS
eukprot:COSAG02_NODE_7000_length_3234_cov_1.806699_3_plen_75_part_00